MKKILFLIGFVLLLVGCGSSNKFLGTWYFQYDEETVSVTFKEKGLCLAEIKSRNEKYSCKYSFDDEKIKVSSDDELFSYEAKYVFNDDIFIVDGVKFYKDLDKFNMEKYVVIKKSDYVEVPDVSGMNYNDAERVLIDSGFRVDTIKEEMNSDVEQGKVIRTSPLAGRKVAKGSDITIYVSNGAQEIIVEEYIGRNYIEVKTMLESYGINVTIQKIAGYETYSPDVIVSQSVKVGTHLSNGDYITLYIPSVYDMYPDFVDEAWTLDEVKKFAEQYNLVLNIKYEETSEYPSGTVIGQSRTGNIVSGSTLTITVAK